jgi:hypothetical protein
VSPLTLFCASPHECSVLEALEIEDLFLIQLARQMSTILASDPVYILGENFSLQTTARLEQDSQTCLVLGIIRDLFIIQISRLVSWRF